MGHIRLACRQSDRHIFDAIKDGSKSVESRAATARFRNIKPGDILVVSCGKDRVEKTVKRVEHFKSIDQLLEQVPITAINPQAKSVDDVYRMYYSFPGYKEKIEQHGLIALWL
jgi:ASC-1-like (ASCH) protein